MRFIVSAASTLSRSFRTSVLLKRLETFIVPQPGEGIAEVEIIQWLVKPSEKIKEFQILCEARSDKGFIEYKSPFEGTLKEIFRNPSEIVKIGEPLFTVDINESKYPEAGASKDLDKTANAKQCGNTSVKNAQEIEITTQTTSKALATPAVRHLAKVSNVDINTIKGTGDDGRVLREDIQRYLDTKAQFNSSSLYSKLAEIPKIQVEPEDKVIKLTSVQKGMVKSMTESLSIPSLTYCEDVYMDAMCELRNSLKNNTKGIKLTYMPFFIKALSVAMLDYPIINSVLKECKTEYIAKKSHNISIAIDSPYGLLVPNIKEVENKSIIEIAVEINRLQDLGSKGRILDSDMQDGTVTISNIGSIGGTYCSPIIFSPQVFIGALGAIRPRLEKVNGEVIEKKIITTSWSADHRIIDGATTARFVARWKELIESPSIILLNLK
jgi:2-oxoisovalerate dehydrogenase E2 component (dihydrolipoyl transacylase)